MKKIRRAILSMTFLVICFGCNNEATLTPNLRLSDNNRYLSSANGDPFFWLGDTGWLLFKKLNREEAEKYLENRRQKGFNVIQAMLIHDINKCDNFYGDSAISGNDISRIKVTAGDSPDNPGQYDYWDHVDYVIRKAGEKGIYMALVPVWGSNVRSGKVSKEQASAYATWLAGRYGKKANVIWLNGGDVKGSDYTDIWNTIGSILNTNTGNQLVTFHPFGRTRSAEWFHNQDWLSFNMFQSGHRDYSQDTAGTAYGEDNWRYMNEDYALSPVKPSLDGEPSYESIPHGLHDTTQVYWTDADVRRYAYWSVFSGACGFTYGHNAVMQFHRKGEKGGAYGVKEKWEDAINAPGSGQLINMKKLMLSKPYYERVPAQELIAGSNGERYAYLVATRGRDYAMIYTYTGRFIPINTSLLGWTEFNASWFNPTDGTSISEGIHTTGNNLVFDPPSEEKPGNDWVLVLEKK
ncbi:MAG: glycoside hydrolase family 140 protein [Bacteroidales bacterium]